MDSKLESDNDPGLNSHSDSVPPPLLSESKSQAAFPQEITWHKLHPLSVLFSFLKSIGGTFIIMVLFFLFTGNYRYIKILVAIQGVWLFFETLRYLRYSYALDASELITREGLIQRVERHIPYDRIQDIRVEKGVLQRWFGVAHAYIETAGGKGVEAALSVIDDAQIAALKKRVFESTTPPEQEESSAFANAISDQSVPLLKLTDRDLIKAGLTSNRAATVLVLLGALWSQMDNFVPEETYLKWFRQAADNAQLWFADGASMNWILLLSGLILIILFSLVFSVVATLVLFKNYTLELKHNDLKRKYGMWTLRTSSIPRHRIQLVKVEESWIRRWFGLAAVKVDVAGPASESEEGSNDGRDLLMPLVKRNRLENLLPHVLAEYTSEPHDLTRVSRCMILRNSVLPALLITLVTCFFSIFHQSPLWLGLMGLTIPVYALNRMAYKHLGYRMEPDYFTTRRGWLNRHSHIIPYRSIQSVIVRQSPFDRRHKVATLQMDSAGQTFTGGPPRVEHVPFNLAIETAQQTAEKASREKFTLR